MAVTSSRCLLSTLCCLFYLLSSIHVPLAASLSFHFNFSDPESTCTAQNAELACSGDAYFHSTENAIELTKNVMGDRNNHSVGRLTYTQPMPLWDGTTGELASFTTSFTFRIKPARQDSPEPSADGMAFFLAHHPSGLPPPGSFGGNLGLFNDSTNRNARGDDRVVAVEFDTFQNAEWGEVDGNHVGIDVNSIFSADSISPNKSIKSGETLAAEVAYDNSTETLSVTLRMNGARYRVSANVDMRRSLPQMVAVGFSAATGRNVEAHQLLSWSFNSSLAMSPGEAPAPVPSQAITSRRHSKAHSSTIAVSAAAAVFVVICALIGFVLRRKLRIWKKSKEASGGGGGGELDDEHDGEAEFEKGVGPKRYHYSELKAATSNFSEEMKLGKGGFGHVYQGCLKIDGQDRRVAIKKFSESSVQGRKEFEAEVKIISRLRHRNLVQLIGWCDSCKGLLIVYELVSEGSLDRHMYKNTRLLTWPQRYDRLMIFFCCITCLHGTVEEQSLNCSPIRIMIVLEIPQHSIAHTVEVSNACPSYHLNSSF